MMSIITMIWIRKRRTRLPNQTKSNLLLGTHPSSRHELIHMCKLKPKIRSPFTQNLKSSGSSKSPRRDLMPTKCAGSWCFFCVYREMRNSWESDDQNLFHLRQRIYWAIYSKARIGIYPSTPTSLPSAEELTRELTPPLRARGSS